MKNDRVLGAILYACAAFLGGLLLLALTSSRDGLILIGVFSIVVIVALLIERVTREKS